MAESILILTEDEDLLDDLLRLCVAADAEAEVVHGGPVAAGQWERAPLVLVGDDRAVARQGAGRWPGRRPGVLLVGRDMDDPTIWARGVALGAEQVLHLPSDEPWLADRIADAVDRPGHPALTVGVIGGRGGAGASSLACALAVTSARQGKRTVLVDGDPLGGGLDILLGGERAPGPRWPAFVSARGRLSGSALDESLPRLHGVSLLSWDRADGARLPGEAMCTVLTAARRGGGLVVVDLPRVVDEAVGEALAQLDLGLLVVPGELRAVAGAQRVVATAGAMVRDLRVVARTASGGLAGAELARLLGLPLAGELPDEPGLSAASDAGEPPGTDARGVLARFSATLIERARAVQGAAV
ncbi:septum site-determining protein Ssd [Streptomyces radicis]|uniref:Septum formation initiator n=1 Tax=Streptomyces radicis TaxID=1750517 RepID=A0A3A9WAU2_9ACTN|nr:septum site-determining protein Ssd [Streptomyces radicis]RKN10155.1 septum formation initiator [Streptomyces radicis]RKN24497.1 septum formation initiator [Streptomyces radicis]